MKIIGSRTVKTAVAVFLTAFICELIGWPPVFAVISAIVTLEPTVTDSIKKGIVRFPASAIGAFYAVLFIALFGSSPLTYTLAATLTIMSCYRLNLHAGLIVATITSVAMIDVIHDHYVQAFFTRLGTTTIGITVSTLVNLLILPRNFVHEINENITGIYENIKNILRSILDEEKDDVQRRLNEASKQIEKTEQLIQFQMEDTRYELPLFHRKENMSHLLDEIKNLRLIVYHMNQLNVLHLEAVSLHTDEKQFIKQLLHDLADVIVKANEKFPVHYEEKLESFIHNINVNKLHRTDTQNNNIRSNEFILIYELMTIYQLIKQLYEIRLNRP